MTVMDFSMTYESIKDSGASLTFPLQLNFLKMLKLMARNGLDHSYN